MASPSNTGGQAEPTASGADSQAISCNRCRRIKLRCSRDRPACSHCSKAAYDCVYEGARGKPGIKAGAVENIHRRLDHLESRLSKQEAKPEIGHTFGASETGNFEPSQGTALSILASELLKLAKSSQTDDGLAQRDHQRANKRRRLDSPPTPVDRGPWIEERPPLPSPDVLDAIVRTYFTHIQPWIPMLHIEVFPPKLKTVEGLRQQLLVVHAMSLAVKPHLSGAPDSPTSTSPRDDQWPASRIRSWIVAKAMNAVSLEGLQALTIVAFTDIGNGNASQAWSLIASLSRTVEFAQLTVDHHQSELHKPICRPYTSLGPITDWTEEEERRRVFWNVFLLDRFCSTTMGWTTSLKSVEVRQRLPCDGGLWRRQQGGTTPFLGIWDKSTGSNRQREPSHWVPGGGYGQSTSTSPLSNEPWTQQPGGMSSGSPDQLDTDTAVDMSRVGAFGYCVEATESMSRVVSCFLQQCVNFENASEVNSWLGRFKELDMRLVHWRMFLPQKWKNIAPPSTPSGEQLRIDPNLTLAHVTHNTSTILLHQTIAYPPAHWSFKRRLPSGWSADTCCLAGAEIATITSKYLEVTPATLPVTSQFTFCVFVAARVMLIHWKFEAENQLMDEFWTLIRCLEEMSRRWRGFGTSAALQMRGNDLAAKYAANLRDLHKVCFENPEFRVSVSNYTREIDYQAPPEDGPDDRYFEAYAQASGSNPNPPQSTLNQHPGGYPMQQPANGHWNSGLAGAMMPASDLTNSAYASQQPVQPDCPSATYVPTDWGLLDESFMDMNRVIAFDERGLFTAELEHAVW
ncbi:hypothetical protein CC79DRAFT_169622 [Sarocladium strictum]